MEGCPCPAPSPSSRPARRSPSSSPVAPARRRSHAAPANPDPGLFAHPGTNPYFPLTPGLVTRLRGTDEGEHYRETVTVTTRHRTIVGVADDRRATTSSAGPTGRSRRRRATGTPPTGTATSGTSARTPRPTTSSGDLESREGSWEAGVDGAVAGHRHAGGPEAVDGGVHGARQGRGRGPGLGRPAVAVGADAGRDVRPRRAHPRVEPPRARRGLDEVLRARVSASCPSGTCRAATSTSGWCPAPGP